MAFRPHRGYTIHNGYIIYTRGKDNPHPAWQGVYKNAIAEGNRIAPIFDPDDINEEVGERLIALGNNEFIKEKALLEAAGITIENEQDIKKFIEQFNSILQGTKNFEKAVARLDSALKHPEIAARAPTIVSWFSSYLTSSLNSVISPYITNNRKTLESKDFSQWENDLMKSPDGLIDKAINLALEKMLNRMEEKEGKELYGDSETWKAYYEAIQQIQNFNEDFKKMIKSKLDFDVLAKMFNNKKAKINLKSKNGRYGVSTFIGSEAGLNLKNGKKSRQLAGSVQEYIELIADSMGIGMQEAMNSGGKVFENEKMKTDNVTIYSFEASVNVDNLAQNIANKLNESLLDNDSLINASKTMKDFYNNNLSKLNNTFIVYGSTKSYSLSDSFRGFHNGGEGSLEKIPEVLEGANITSVNKAKDFIYKVYNTAKYAIYSDKREQLTEELKKSIMAAAANLLFDDWSTIGEENLQGGAQCIHALQLEGIRIPLSVFLKATGYAIKNTSKDMERYFKVNLKVLESAREEWAPEGKTVFSGDEKGEHWYTQIYEAWEAQAQDARDAGIYSIKFLTNFKTIIRQWIDV